MKFLLCFFVFLLSGCEYIPNKVYKIKTVDGDVLSFSCPIIDENRSRYSFVYGSDCRLVVAP